MAIRYLNCGTMRPYFPRVENGVTCLLIETNKGPVLVDTGFGVSDYIHPNRIMHLFMMALRSPRDINETSIKQVQRLGYQPTDVGHIVMTHLHLDHAGGLSDFPHARVHVYQPEYEHIVSEGRRFGYLQEHWAHEPDWVPHELSGEKWYDFDGIRLEGFEPEIWLVPFIGHTPGHSAVIIRKGDGWVMHGGDAVPFNMAVDDIPDWISGLVIGPHVPRIREFIKAHPEIEVVGAHMALDFYKEI